MPLDKIKGEVYVLWGEATFFIIFLGGGVNNEQINIVGLADFGCSNLDVVVRVW